MHELLLYGSVPVARHEQVLKILAGIAAMQPKSLYQRQSVFRPLAPTEEVKPNKKYPNKPVKPATLTYHRLEEDLAADDFGKEISMLSRQGADDLPGPARTCTMKILETPEPETKSLVLRPASEINVTDEVMQRILDPAKYSFVTELFLEGHRLVHKNIVLTFFRLLRADNQGQTAPSAVMPSLESLIPLDPSGAFMLEARVRIDDRTKPSLVSAASDELAAFRDLMKGSVDMRAPERLALDTRVR